MVPLKKLHGIAVPEEFKHVYKHYLEQEEAQVKVAYSELIKILDTCHTDKKSQRINRQLKSKISLEIFTKKVYSYFLKILYVLISEGYGKPVSIKTCINDASEYAISEYLSVSILSSI